MVFEMPYWKYRLQEAKTQEDFTQLLEDLPDNPACMLSQDIQKSTCAAQRTSLAPLILNTSKGKIVVG